MLEKQSPEQPSRSGTLAAGGLIGNQSQSSENLREREAQRVPKGGGGGGGGHHLRPPSSVFNHTSDCNTAACLDQRLLVGFRGQASLVKLVSVLDERMGQKPETFLSVSTLCLFFYSQT